MKRLVFFLSLLLLSGSLYAQRTIPVRNLWTRAQVHVLFNGYRVSFAIRDINKALVLLRQEGDNMHVLNCGLDTARTYTYELYPGLHTEYRDVMEPLLQQVVGPFLLTTGRCIIENGKRQVLKEFIADIQSDESGGTTTTVDFYDPKTHKLLFSGIMPMVLYKKDLGIDD